MKAKIKNKLNGEIIVVTSTTTHPDCSYGQSVWVDDNNNAYSVVGLESPMYDIVEMEINDRVELGSFIHNVRVSQGITVRGMAEKSGIMPSTVQNVEKGAFSPRLDIIKKMLDALGAKMKISTL